MIAHVRQWLAGRSERERRLLALAAAVSAVLGAGSVGLAVRDDLAAMRARVAAHERDLAAVRRAAARIAGSRPAAGDSGALMSRVQAATDAARLGERVAAMTPADGPEGARLAVRLAGTSLAETVQLLHALDDAAVARLALRKLRDDPHRFDVTLEIAGGGS